MTNENNTIAKILWDFNLLNHSLEKADYIIALGSHDISVADRAADLVKRGFDKQLIKKNFSLTIFTRN